ncbi:MAG: trimethylamine methyltransferase family protein, partial [Bacillota bacterium]|nr:trimethylamine methyltransferase family protein [Bacillota bacterium]
MAIKGLKSYYNENVTSFRALTEEQVEQVILGAFEILENTGLRSNDRICQLYKKAGAKVEGNIVKVPREMVIKAINSAPKSVKLYNRNSDKVLDVGGTNAFVGSGPTNPFFQDFETNKRRRSMLYDCANSAKIMEALPEFDFVMSLSDPADTPPELKDLYSLEAMLENTDKPIVSLVNDIYTLKEQMEMIEALYGSLEAFLEKPSVIMLNGETSTPLCSEEEVFTDKYFYCAERNIPQIIISFIQLGTVAPVTLANAVMLAVAENFYLLTITQLVNPGAPDLCSVISGSVDMKSTRTCYSTPEHVLCEAAGADVFHYLNLPTLGTGGTTCSKMVDEQCAIEQAFTLGFSILDGGNLIHDVGFMEDGLTSHYDALTMVNDIAGYARRIKDGIRFDADSTDLNNIHEVGHGGEYLTRMETFQNCRKEIWYPELHDRNNSEKWAGMGATDLRTRVHEKTKAILAEPTPERISAEVKAK